MNTFVEAGVTIALAVVGLATVSILVSKNAQTSNVFQAGASSFNNALGVAESPVTGSSMQLNLSYPSSGINMGMS
jgi:hypothetical protein